MKRDGQTNRDREKGGWEGGREGGKEGEGQTETEREGMREGHKNNRAYIDRQEDRNHSNET